LNKIKRRRRKRKT